MRITRPARLRACLRLLALRARPAASACRLRQQQRRQHRAARSTEGGSAGAIVSNPDNGKVNLTIGSKNFPEQEILGEIYAQALKAAGYKVKTDLNLGSETVALKALKPGRSPATPSTPAPR